MDNTNKIIEPFDDKELEIATKEAEQDYLGTTGVYTHHFNRPFTIDGETIEELVFDFESLTGADSLAIENELAVIGKAVIVPEIAGEYLIRMAVRACTTKVNGKRLGVDAFKKLPLGDYNRIRGKARSFLLRSGL